MKKFFFAASFLIVMLYSQAANNVASPDKQINVTYDIGDQVTWSVSFNGKSIIRNGVINLIVDGKEMMKNQKVRKAYSGLVVQTVTPAVPLKFADHTVQYNQEKLVLKNGISLVFRVYNNGVAYRILTDFRKEKTVDTEVVQFGFEPGSSLLFPQEDQLMSHYERSYLHLNINEVKDDMFCSLPMLATSNGVRIGVTEADVLNYPQMFLKGHKESGLTSLYPNYPLEIKAGDRASDRSEVITKEAEYIAKINPGQELPWRVFMIAADDKALLENNLPVCLNSKAKINTEWIRPGKVAWDWWNANNIYGVDFRSGINTETYKYYIDFASEYGLEYIILDEGWSKSTTNILEPNDEINLEELISYGKEKNVKLILWVLWKPLDQHLNAALELYEKMGVAGIKVDFMQRADQLMVEYYEKVAREAAKHKLLVDFHGAFKPSGIEAVYPNVVNYEGVKGLENCKWSDLITPEHDVTLPFTRMLAGPMDYTPGAMHNAQEINFSISFDRPMSQGTRCHQASMYVIYEAPLQMFADNPSNYLRDPQYTSLVARFPTTWDDTRVLEAKVADYVVLARKKGQTWYIGGMTDWTEREFDIPLDFLVDGKLYKLTLLSDGINANRMAEDYKISRSNVVKGTNLHIKMAMGGGFAGILEPVDE
ncbi:glycoside hydrolase family 97 catalytic domain-containing protein [Saccharicrinis sp. FJH54]|uniref:glycoside hydrolase family 97 protein n=1 Tax=Saccharicrinis sp. FJH54 TaxID=3344665 RepID=UPI0035D50B64